MCKEMTVLPLIALNISPYGLKWAWADTLIMTRLFAGVGAALVNAIINCWVI
jgi:hypothetical protein